MKFSKKIFSLITSVLVLTSAFTCTNGISAKAATTDKPVELYYTKVVNDNAPAVEHYAGYIAVKNLAYEKKVIVHYNYTSLSQASNIWYTANANYLKNNPSDGNEVWKFETPSVYTNYGGLGDIQYYIEYDVNGQTFYDNNNGKNYKSSDFGASRPYVTSLSGYARNNGECYLSCSVATKKSVSPEVVRIRYSQDNWTTYKDVDLVKSTNVYFNEDSNSWIIDIPILPGKQTKLAAYYVVNGVQYWDNNLGDNYNYNF